MLREFNISKHVTQAESVPVWVPQLSGHLVVREHPLSLLTIKIQEPRLPFSARQHCIVSALYAIAHPSTVRCLST